MKNRYNLYTSESELQNLIKLFRKMIVDLSNCRELAWQLMVRDIKAQYRQSIFGYFWAFVPAIFTAAGLTYARNAGVLNIGETDLPYPAYVMFSMTLWQTFVESVNGQVQAVTRAKHMLARINFPREALVVEKIGEVLFNFSIKLILIICLFVWYKMPIGWTIIIAPFVLILLILLGTTVGMILAPIGALYQDVTRILSVIFLPWLLVTPVIYPVPNSSTFSSIVKYNPVSPLLVTIRELVTGSSLTFATEVLVVGGITMMKKCYCWVQDILQV